MSRDKLADSAAQITVKREETPYSGHCKVTVTELTLHDAGGDVGMKREVFHVGPAAIVLPYDPVRDEVVLLRQFRLPPHMMVGQGEMVETAAGLFEEGEDPAETARRELQEEAGLSATAMEKVLEAFPSCGFVAEHSHYFVARVDAANLPERAGLDTESEVTRPFAVDAREAIAAARANRMRNAHTLMLLMLFEGLREDLRKRWTNGA